MKKFKLSKFLSCIVLFSPAVASCSFIASCSANKIDVAILFTNDTHCKLENTDTGLGWAELKGYKNWLEDRNITTILTDSGDFSQGGVYGTLSKGQYIIDLMNACDYDIVAPGNHEFDYGIEQFYKNANDLKAKYLSSNLYHCQEDEQGNIHLYDRVLDDTTIVKAGKYKIGFLGIDTSSTLTSSVPSYFDDPEGRQIYTFLEYDIGKYYSTIQSSINKLHDEGVDYVIALTHLGIGDSGEYEVYGSQQLIKNTSGLDVVLDGHSHTVEPCKKIKDKENKEVYLAQTGTQFESFGQLNIHHNGSIDIDLIDNKDDIESTPDPTVAAKVEQIEQECRPIVDEVVGQLPSDLELIQKNKDGKRISRNQECNLGDFIADGFRSFYDSSIPAGVDKDHVLSCINGGSCRANIKNNKDGNVTFGDILQVQPFGNSAAVLQLPGSILLDALEFSFAFANASHEEDEFGGFLQWNSDVNVKVDLSIPTPVEVNGAKEFVKIDETKPRRVWSATINNKPINKDETYYLIGNAYTLFSFGDGYKMFDDASCIPCDWKLPQEDDSLDIRCTTKYLQSCISSLGFDKYYLEYLSANPRIQYLTKPSI